LSAPFSLVNLASSDIRNGRGIAKLSLLFGLNRAR
jgi:hypothetical protein